MVARTLSPVSAGFEVVTNRGAAPVLPDDGAVKGLAGFARRSRRCFALVGNAEGGDPVAVPLDSLGDVAQRGDGEIGDLNGVVFDFAGGGENTGSVRDTTRPTTARLRSKATARTPVVPASRQGSTPRPSG